MLKIRQKTHHSSSSSHSSAVAIPPVVMPPLPLAPPIVLPVNPISPISLGHVVGSLSRPDSPRRLASDREAIVARRLQALGPDENAQRVQRLMDEMEGMALFPEGEIASWSRQFSDISSDNPQSRADALAILFLDVIQPAYKHYAEEKEMLELLGEWEKEIDELLSIFSPEAGSIAPFSQKMQAQLKEIETFENELLVEEIGFQIRNAAIVSAAQVREERHQENTAVLRHHYTQFHHNCQQINERALVQSEALHQAIDQLHDESIEVAEAALIIGQEIVAQQESLDKTLSQAMALIGRIL